MEMQEIPEDKETGKEEEDEGASKPTVEVKPKEEAEANFYSSLQIPSEDVYSEAFSGDKAAAAAAPAAAAAAGKQTEGNVRRYRAACVFLTVICLVLLLVVVFLALKLQTGTTVCPVSEDATADIKADGRNPPFAPTCSFEQCQAQFPDNLVHRVGCQQCSNGWLAFGRSCYYLSTIRMNWTESQKNCTARGGSLAVISSQKVQSFLTTKGNLKYWIGLRHKDDAWTWVNNTMLRESYWAENPQNGDCGILCSDSTNEKNWITASCQAQTYFICELQL